jgi:hypothetical protein
MVPRQPGRDSTVDEATTREQPETAAEAVAAERRRRGDGPPTGSLKVPGRLGASFWKDNPFVPPADDDDEQDVKA